MTTMRIGVFIQSLARVLTTGTPYRGMLRELLRIRPVDTFELYVSRDSECEPLLLNWLETLDTHNWALVPLPIHRRTMALRALLGLRVSYRISRDIHLLMASDLSFHDFQLGPQISQFYDLGAIRGRQNCSLAWHGRRARKNQLRTLGGTNVHICTISDFSRQELLNYDARFDGRVEVVPCGISPEWHASPSVPLSAPRPPGVSRPYWIWWGQLTARKNLDGLLRAFHEISQSDNVPSAPDLVFVGATGPAFVPLRQLAHELAIAQKVKPFPHQDIQTLVSWVTNSDGIVFPSHYEGFGLPVVEALACGKPVLTSNAASMPEVAGGHAICVDPSDIRSMASGLLELLHAENSPETKQARRQWASQFTDLNAAQTYSSIINRLSVMFCRRINS